MSQEEKDQKISELERENKALREKIAELERCLEINSETSSKPPSSDVGLFHSPRARKNWVKQSHVK
jgi:hypothetical protein